MKIDYTILKKLLDCNKSIKLKFIEDTSTLQIIVSNRVVKNIELNGNTIENHSETIYNAILNLEDITIYIPKIYIQE